MEDAYARCSPRTVTYDVILIGRLAALSFPHFAYVLFHQRKSSCNRLLQSIMMVKKFVLTYHCHCRSSKQSSIIKHIPDDDESITASLQKPDGGYGWVIVASVFWGMFASVGLVIGGW